MKLSVFTVITPEYTFEQLCGVLKANGYSGAEIRVKEALKGEPNPLPPRSQWYWQYNKCTADVDTLERDAASIRKTFDIGGVEIFSLSTYLSMTEDIDKVKSVVRAAKSIGCKNIRVQSPAYDGSVSYQALFEAAQAALTELVAYAGKDVRLLIEVHPGYITPSVSAVYRLVSGFSPEQVGVIHDAANMMKEGFESLEMGLDILGPYLACVHIKNVVPVVQETRPDGTVVWSEDWSPLPKGLVNNYELLKILTKKLKYNGYYCVEDFYNEMDTVSKLRANREYLERLLKEIN